MMSTTTGQCLQHSSPNSSCVTCQAWVKIDREQRRLALEKEALTLDQKLARAEQKVQKRKHQQELQKQQHAHDVETEKLRKNIQTQLQQESQKQQEHHNQDKLELEKQIQTLQTQLERQTEQMEKDKNETQQLVETHTKETKSLQVKIDDLETQVEQNRFNMDLLHLLKEEKEAWEVQETQLMDKIEQADVQVEELKKNMATQQEEWTTKEMNYKMDIENGDENLKFSKKEIDECCAQVEELKQQIVDLEQQRNNDDDNKSRNHGGEDDDDMDDTDTAITPDDLTNMVMENERLQKEKDEALASLQQQYEILRESSLKMESSNDAHSQKMILLVAQVETKQQKILEDEMALQERVDNVTMELDALLKEGEIASPPTYSSSSSFNIPFDESRTASRRVLLEQQPKEQHEQEASLIENSPSQNSYKGDKDTNNGDAVEDNDGLLKLQQQLEQMEAQQKRYLQDQKYQKKEITSLINQVDEKQQNFRQSIPDVEAHFARLGKQLDELRDLDDGGDEATNDDSLRSYLLSSSQNDGIVVASATSMENLKEAPPMNNPSNNNNNGPGLGRNGKSVPTQNDQKDSQRTFDSATTNSSNPNSNTKRSNHVTNYSYTDPKSGLSGRYTGYMSQETGPTERGSLKFNNGDMYEGEFKDGVFQGHGVYTSANGELYTGSFLNGKRHGNGALIGSNGEVYDGGFENGKRHGMGTLTREEGGKYEGAWANDKRDGSGVYHYPDGRTYTGEYKDNRPHGQGIETSHHGRVIYEGQWSYGEFVAKSKR